MSRRVLGLGLVAMLGLGLSSAAWALAAANGRLTGAQEQRLTALFRQSDRYERDGEVVKAFSTLHEASRLEQLWTNNVAGYEAVSTRRLNRLVLTLVRRDDGSVQRILHSRQVALGDKLGLIHVLEQDVLVNYPGSRDAGLVGGDE